MSITLSTLKLARAARHGSQRQSDITTSLSRCLSSTVMRCATPTLHPTTKRDQRSQRKSGTLPTALKDGKATPSYESMTPAQRATRASERARERLEEQQQQYSSGSRLGGLAENSLFHDVESTSSGTGDATEPKAVGLENRNLENMSFALNPRPSARARWQRKMLIRHIRHRGRLTKEVQIARTERSHLSKSHFFKTSMKKLAPLARQIAGKSIDEAILQMRFSKKKAAKEVRAHLIQAKDEAVVIKGMGLGSLAEAPEESKDSPVASDPGITPPLAQQNPTKSMKPGFEKSPTDMYISQAWVNRGPYGMEPEYRARGRTNILRPPWTGISVELKEEKTRTREKAEKEAKAIRKRMGKNMWTQLPDRPITRQSQYVLW